VRFFFCTFAVFVACTLAVFADDRNQDLSPPSGQPGAQKQQFLWDKLEARIAAIDRRLDGVLGVAILDLTNVQKFLLHGDEIFPQASSIKIPVLAELYRQEQMNTTGKARLSDLYTVRQADLVPDSDILLGLTPGVTRITNRDLATMMVAVSDNSATNILIDRLGMENVNALLDQLGLKHTRLRRKMMDLKAAQEGRENISTPREMMMLLEALHQGKVLNKTLTEDFFRMLGTHKDSALLRGLPDGVRAATKPGALEGVRNDSGIVFAKNRPFVLCIMTTYLRNEKQGEEAISDIAAAAYQQFERIGRGSPYGRTISPYNSSSDVSK
jgi:beta-lactamase class A